MEFSDANSTWESWYFKICWWTRKCPNRFDADSDLEGVETDDHQKIKDARDHLSAAGVYFEDDDIVTKGLSTPLFRRHCSNLMLGSSKPAVEGECQDIKGSVVATCQEIREYNG